MKVTFDYMVPYQRFDDEIRLVSINSSQSFELPSESQLIQKKSPIVRGDFTGYYYK